MNRYLAFMCIVLLTGCASIERRQESFETRSFKYENAVRWGYFDRAYDFIRADGEDVEKPDFQKLQHFRVTTYEVLRSKVSAQKLEVRQTVEIKYYNIRNLIEKTLLDEQHWVFSREEKQWYLKSGFPGFN